MLNRLFPLLPQHYALFLLIAAALSVAVIQVVSYE